ncbi:DUF6916 family protein [Pseudoduganella violaceinigra]|uniref:DUF6916 family protein n=1 Tax=Pseudoduganella violaceinigra TaxID=246602 RepID=UPI000418B11A|nr:hypothetical protein [Pseudoduganella violaceinigra]
MERRNFVLSAGGLLAAPALARAAALAALPPTPSTIGMAGFSKLLGQQFIAYQGKRGTALELVAVRSGKAAPHQDQFTLFFAGTQDLDDGIYEIDNSASGRLSVYMIPAGKDRRGALYRADFSLLV